MQRMNTTRSHSRFTLFYPLVIFTILTLLVSGCGRSRPPFPIVTTDADLNTLEPTPTPFVSPLPSPSPSPLSTPSPSPVFSPTPTPTPDLQPTVNLTVNGLEQVAVNSGSMVVLRWQTTNAARCELSRAGVKVAVQVNEANGVNIGPMIQSESIELFCFGPVSKTASDSVLVLVNSAPSVELFLDGVAASKVVPYDEFAKFSWSTENASSCTFSSNGMVLSTALQMNELRVGPIRASASFELRCMAAGDVIVVSRAITLGEPSFHLIFITSTRHAGNFGGLDGGNDICKARAMEAGLRTDRNWKAVLSDDQKSAVGRILRKPIYNTKGTRIDTGAGIFVDPMLANPIVYDERGNSAVLVSTNVWTGSTTTGGSDVGNNCGNWTSTSGKGRAALGDSTSGWLSYGDGTCSAAKHLYCVSQ